MSLPISRRGVLLGMAGSVSLAHAAAAIADDPFVVFPYVQLGDAPHPAGEEQLSVLWHTSDLESLWRVEFRSKGTTSWGSAAQVSSALIAVSGIPPHRVFEAVLKPLVPGAEVEYRVRRGDRVEYAAAVRARPRADRPFRCVVVGDCGTGSPQQKKIADQIYRREPEFVFVPGDLVYNDGRISEYRSSFFPVYTHQPASPEQGAPLLSSTVLFGGRGQHDTQAALARHADGHAFFYYWSFPLNGPLLDPKGAHVFPPGGTDTADEAFRNTTGRRFPRMASYSFEWGLSHWTMLDTWNPHIDWTDPQLREWLKNDFAAARDARWKFVGSYMPPFSSSTMYPQGQKMRVIADLLEEAGVDIVFSGYAHSYQRTYPLRFTPDRAPVGPVRDPAQTVPGRWRLDTRFDGKNVTRPDGVLYIVTGCGGNPQLHSPEQTDAPQTWQPYTAKYHASLHQFTELDVAADRLTLRQISLDGDELDRVIVTKP